MSSHTKQPSRAPAELGPMSADDLRAMAGRGLAAVPKFLCPVPNSQFYRDAASQRKPSKAEEEKLYPTATAHGLLALLDVGAYSSRDVRRAAPLDKNKPGESRPLWSRSTHSHIEIPKPLDKNFSMPYLHDFLERMTRAESGNPGSFVQSLYMDSSHSAATRAKNGTPSPDAPFSRSELILFGHVAPALVFGCDYVARFYSAEVFDGAVQDVILASFRGLVATIAELKKLLGYQTGPTHNLDLDADHCWSHVGKLSGGPGAKDPNPAFPSSGIPTYLLYNATLAVCSLLQLSSVVETFNADAKKAPVNFTDALTQIFTIDQRTELAEIQKDLALAIRRRLERIMANRGIHDDPLFDPVGLAFATRAMCLLDPGFRQRPLFREAIATVVECQLPDGCWPDGTATNSRHGTATLQPSVEVAYALAASVHTRSARQSPTAAEVVAMKLATPAIQRHARYLELTFLDNARGEGSGWPNDRSRHSSNPELWITALSVRFLHFAALITDAVNRTEVLIRYDPSLVARVRGAEENQGEKKPLDTFEKDVVEPETFTSPRKLLLDRFIKPIAKKMRERRYITRPARDGVSFLLFGPPRSGKTFLVTSLAKSLSWPLLSLDPGNFVPRSGESVGAMMSRVFDDLKQLHDVVVLFDECDELLISRDQEFADVRMPLITSSLLTRLSSLKAQRGPIFCFATNYYHRVDSAARGVGRFDAVLMFDRPNAAARESIVASVWTKVWEGHNAALGGVGVQTLPPQLVKQMVTGLCGCAYLEIQRAVFDVGLLLFGDGGILVHVPRDKQLEKLDELLISERALTEGVAKAISQNSPSRTEYFRWCFTDGLDDIHACEGGTFSNKAKLGLVENWLASARSLGAGLGVEIPTGTAEEVLEQHKKSRAGKRA